jgi:hypothetical protein
VPRVVTDKDPENISVYTTSGPITAEVLLVHNVVELRWLM